MNPSQPGTCCVAQANLKLRILLPLSLPSTRITGMSSMPVTWHFLESPFYFLCVCVLVCHWNVWRSEDSFQGRFSSLMESAIVLGLWGWRIEDFDLQSHLTGPYSIVTPVSVCGSLEVAFMSYRGKPEQKTPQSPPPQRHTSSNKATPPRCATPFGGHLLLNHHTVLSISISKSLLSWCPV